MLFSSPDAWIGGDFEMSLEFRSTTYQRLRMAAVALWTHPTLDGCYLLHDVEPGDQKRYGPEDRALTFKNWRWRGVATLPNSVPVACATYCIRSRGKWDRLFLYIPMGSLGKAYDVGAYPLDDGKPLEWREPVSQWMIDVAQRVHDVVPFRLGLIGDGMDNTITARRVREQGIPEKRWDGYIWPERGRLHWYPPNQGATFSQ